MPQEISRDARQLNRQLHETTINHRLAVYIEKNISEAYTKLNDEELAGYDFVKEREEVSRKEYEEHFRYNARKANRHLNKFLELGLIGLIGDNGKGITSPNYRYVNNG